MSSHVAPVQRLAAWVSSRMVLLAGMCLGPDGFGFCNAKSLWILAYTHPTKKTKAIVSMLAPEPERMCLGSSSGGWFSSLRPVGVSKCVDGLDGDRSYESERECIVCFQVFHSRRVIENIRWVCKRRGGQ